MLKLRFILILLLTLSAVLAKAQQKVIRPLVLQTADVLTQKKLDNAFRLKQTYPDSMTALFAFNQLVTALRELGHVEAGIDEITWRNDSALIQLHAGPKYQFGKIEPGNVPSGVLKKVGFKSKLFEGRGLEPKRLSRLKKRIIRFYENRGFPFAEVSLEDIKLDSNRLVSTLKLEKNAEFKIDSLINKGTSKINVKYLQSYLGVKPKDLYNESRISTISTHVKEIPFVSQTQQPQVLFADGKADVFLFLDKKRASQFDGILGVLPSSEDPGKVLVTGELSLKLMSAFRRGELIDLSWRKMQARTQNLNVHIAYPFLFNTAFGLDGTFELYKRDTLYLNLNGVIGVQYHLIGNDHIKVFADIRSTNVLAPSVLTSTSTLNPDNVDSRTQLYGFGYKMQRLDYRLNPRKGFDLYAEASAGTKKILPDATIDDSRYDGLKQNSFQMNAILTSSYFIPIPNRSTIKVGVKGGYMRSANLFESEAFRLGGLRTLRGFDEESIYATMYGIGTIEYRFLLNMDSYLFAFFDGAYYENRATNKRVTDRPFGFGLGISFATKIGIFSLNYALGKQFKNPIDFRAGKIHFGVISFF